MKDIYYIDTEGWVTEEWLLNEYVNSTEQRNKYDLFKKAIIVKEEQVQED